MNEERKKKRVKKKKKHKKRKTKKEGNIKIGKKLRTNNDHQKEML